MSEETVEPARVEQVETQVVPAYVTETMQQVAEKRASNPLPWIRSEDGLKEYGRVTVSKPMLGLCFMQICAVDDATDEELLACARMCNPCGTQNGWSKVHRTLEDCDGAAMNMPGPCAEYEGRTHFLISC